MGSVEINFAFSHFLTEEESKMKQASFRLTEEYIFGRGQYTKQESAARWT